MGTASSTREEVSTAIATALIVAIHPVKVSQQPAIPPDNVRIHTHFSHNDVFITVRIAPSHADTHTSS